MIFVSGCGKITVDSKNVARINDIYEKKMTIYDIAKLSGYSPKTVSRVINGEKSVKPETREIITRIINTYHYTPNVYAKNLTKKTAMNILISIKKRESFPLIWFQTLLDKVLITCKELGVNTIVEYFSQGDNISDLVLSASGSLVDGVVIFYEEENDVCVEYLQKNGIPFIVFGRSNNSDVIYVNNDDYGALYNLTKQFVASGHKHIWMLMGGDNSVNRERIRGAEHYIAEHNLKQIKLEVFKNLSTIESVYKFVHKHISKQLAPDAIFVSGDEKVQGLIRACFDKGIQIPKDISVVGFDNIPISQYYTPALSTIAPNYVELSRQLVGQLLKIIDGGKAESIEVQTKFIKRQST